jgi:HEAT repeat protein
MKSVRIPLAIVLLLFIGTGVFYFVDPESRIKGLIAGEAKFQGRYASAWAKDLADSDDNRRTATKKTLAEGKAEALPMLTILAQGSQPESVRLASAELIGQLGVEGRSAATVLIDMLNDPEQHIQTLAVKSLAKLAPDVPGAVPALVKKFPNVEAIRAVSAFKSSAAEAVTQLTELLTHQDVAVRWNAARTLGKIGEPALSALPAIVKQLGDPEPQVREHAAEAIGDIGPKAAAAIPDLVKALKDPDTMVRKDAVRALGQMGPAAKSVIADVSALKKDKEKIVVDFATIAERQIDPSLAGPKNQGRMPKSDD